jgi:ABC-type Fe3+-hydroxamate transport system substrate-binding protein
MPVFVDQLGRKLSIASKPKRIISLVPSQTELLYDLDLHNEVIGITKFCIHPESWFRSKARIGGTKNIHIETIKTLQPDLIIANKEENVKDQIEILAQDFPVWISDINNLEDAMDMIKGIGMITAQESKALSIIDTLQASFQELKEKKIVQPLKTAYLIWKDPYMTVGGDTFIHDMLIRVGFDNIFKNHSRYPVIDIADLFTKHCELLLLSSEPYPFSQKHIDALQSQLPKTKILLVDGEMFSWYGSRLLQTPAYIKGLHQQIASIS